VLQFAILDVLFFFSYLYDVFLVDSVLNKLTASFRLAFFLEKGVAIVWEFFITLDAIQIYFLKNVVNTLHRIR
jgi:hypothetical protein